VQFIKQDAAQTTKQTQQLGLS